MSRVLCNFDVASYYPNSVRLYGYSSRNQKDKQAYVDILNTRIKAKYGKLEESFLKEFNTSNEELKGGLKLPINAYTGTLRATFNDLYDPLQGFSICTTCQLLMLQLIHDLQQIPTLEMVSANTDAVMFTIEESEKPKALQVLDEWQKHTGFELEEDKIVKIVMRDVNNYAEIVQTGDDDYEVHYKGGELTRGEHKFKWNKEKHCFEYSYKKSLKSNSLSIVSEALLKELLFDIPVEETINNCNDILRFQMITHLGSTYEKIVQESPDGDIELQKNNRIYAGLKPSGILIKVKSDGRRDSLANCPTNPIVDNKNELTIDKIDKSWYIKIAKQRVNDFKGIKRMENYKKDELLDYCKRHDIPTDKKMKKDEILKIIEKVNAEKEERKEMRKMNIYQKINELRRKVREHEFVMDKELPTNLGGGEYASIGQYYDVVQNACLEIGLDFSWEVTELVSFEKALFQPQGKPAQHVWTVKCIATLVDVETGEIKTYTEIGSGSDICDKGVSGASTLAFRNWFDKNFSPKNNDDENFADETPKTEAPKVPTYVPPTKKEAIKEEVVNTPQKQDSDKEKAEKIAEKIMQIREISGNDSYGTSVINAITTGAYESADIMEWDLKVQNKLDSLMPFEG